MTIYQYIAVFTNSIWGCVKMLTQPFFMRKAQTFSSPGFVITQSFSIFRHKFSLWQSYIFVLTFPTKQFFFLKELMKILRRTIRSA